MSASSARPVLVTGGAGFIGANLSDALARSGRTVLVYDSLERAGAADNLARLVADHGALIVPITADVRDEAELRRAVEDADAAFHFAAQVAVTTSLQDPRTDFMVNASATFALLEALRAARRRIPLVFASTNKVYGALDDLSCVADAGRYEPLDAAISAFGVPETRPLDFHTPYGCSKGAADQYVLDYARSFDVAACVMRMSCIYGPRQRGVEDQGWVAHFALAALDRRPLTIFGDGMQVRDVLHVGDAVRAYLSAWRRIDAVAGRAFNLGGGPANAVTLREVLGEIEKIIDARLDLRFAPWRAGDQRWYVSDARAARRALGLPAPRGWRDGLRDLVAWLQEERSAGAGRLAAALESAPA